MTTTARPSLTTVRTDPAYGAFLLLRSVFVAAPILFGLDKFFNLMTDWPHYLAPWIDQILPGDAQTGMYIIGVIEIVAGLLVAAAPRIGAWVVALWLTGIIVNLVTFSAFYTLADYGVASTMYDIALRDFGLLVGAAALGLLANKYAPTTIGILDNHRAHRMSEAH